MDASPPTKNEWARKTKVKAKTLNAYYFSLHSFTWRDGSDAFKQITNKFLNKVRATAVHKAPAQPQTMLHQHVNITPTLSLRFKY